MKDNYLLTVTVNLVDIFLQLKTSFQLDRQMLVCEVVVLLSEQVQVQVVIVAGLSLVHHNYYYRNFRIARFCSGIVLFLLSGNLRVTPRAMSVPVSNVKLAFMP